MSDVILQVENLGKRYFLDRQYQRKYTTLRDSLSNGASALFKKNPHPQAQLSASKREEFWALKDVSFEVRQGERVGIVGRNGAGKSTLLKILSRITEPTSGRVRIRGRVASLLEVGTGFHPELSGRENIFLNGAILGMSESEISTKFDEIVDFAEIEKFLDTPVKRYSSGMYVRLAFAVAAHLEPEILIIDEVLAVGDIQFQKKCLGKVKTFGNEGRTVLFVSHNMSAIGSLCSTGIMLDRGNVAYCGNVERCISEYEIRNSEGQGNVWLRPTSQKSGDLVITQITSVLTGSQPSLTLNLDIKLESRAQHKPGLLAVDILSLSGVGLMQAVPQVAPYINDTEPEHTVQISIDLPPLIPNQYLVSVWVGSHNTETLDVVKDAIMFDINESPIPERIFPYSAEQGYIVPTAKINNISSKSLSISGEDR
jgi:lipopolysaccharide transport system ATP-binding protein